MRVSPKKGERNDLFRKHDRVSIRAEFKVARKKRFVFRGRPVAEMPDLQFSWRYTAVGQLSAQTHDCSQPKLHLVPIRTSIHVSVMKRDNHRSIRTEME